MDTKEIKKPYKQKTPGTQKSESTPRLNTCQHIKILDCDKPINRIFYECWHCKQGLLSEVEVSGEVLEIPCPTCGKTAIRLMAKNVLSTTAIPSPWE